MNSIGSAIQIQAAYRGYITRKHTLLPKDIAPFFLNEEREKEVVILICRVVNNWLSTELEPEFISDWPEDEKILLNPASKVKKRRYTQKREYQLPEAKPFYLHSRDNRFYLVFPDEPSKLLAEGTKKKIYTSRTISIPLETTKKCAKFRSVLMDIKVNISVIEDANTLYKALYEEWLEEQPVNVHLLEPLDDLKCNAFTQRRLTGDLRSLWAKGKISNYEAYHCIIDVANTLMWFHQQDWIHCDVKLDNILISKSLSLRRYVGYLTDFDLSGPPETVNIFKKNDYAMWDICMNDGMLRTPLADWSGFVVMLLEVLIHQKFALIKQAQRAVYHNDAFNAAFYWRGSPFEKLPDLTKEVWKLYISLCKESGKAYKEMKKKKKPDIRAAILKVQSFDHGEACLKLAKRLAGTHKPSSCSIS